MDYSSNASAAVIDLTGALSLSPTTARSTKKNKKKRSFQSFIDNNNGERKQPPITDVVDLIDDDDDDGDRKPAARSISFSSGGGEDWKPAASKNQRKLGPVLEISSSEEEDDSFLALATTKSNTIFASAAVAPASSSNDFYVDDDHSFALALQKQEHDLLQKQQAENDKKMHASIAGKAWLFVLKVQTLLATLGADIEPVAVDDMVFLTERLLVAQEEFGNKIQTSTHVDLGYHYTRSENLVRIKTDGLLTRQERDASQIASRFNGSAYGDGVYTAANPWASKNYGDVGLLVARLKGIEKDHPCRFDGKIDSIVVRRNSPHEFVVLEKSYQCLPLAQFSSSLIENMYSTDSPGNKKMFDYQVKMQALVDDFFNGGVRTTVSPWQAAYANPLSVSSQPAMQALLQLPQIGRPGMGAGSAQAAANSAITAAQAAIQQAIQQQQQNGGPGMGAGSAHAAANSAIAAAQAAMQQTIQQQQQIGGTGGQTLHGSAVLPAAQAAQAAVQQMLQQYGVSAQAPAMQALLQVPQIGGPGMGAGSAQAAANSAIAATQASVQQAIQQQQQGGPFVHQAFAQSSLQYPSGTSAASVHQAALQSTRASVQSTNAAMQTLQQLPHGGASGAAVSMQGMPSGTIAAARVFNRNGLRSSRSMHSRQPRTAAPTSLAATRVPNTLVRGPSTQINSEREERIQYNAPHTLSTVGAACFQNVHVASSSTCLSEECAICLDAMSFHRKVARLNVCGHHFHQKCIEGALRHSPNCPTCRKLVDKPQGRMPSGTMTISRLSVSCSGHEPAGSISISYSIPCAVQKEYHTNPGQSHGSAYRTAYLPDTADGNKLLRRLKFAFSHGLTFTVGTSLTTRQPNSVVWSIHHKTSFHSGAHGFPDASFFENCNKELEARNVPPADEL